jgi:hypothetical protein
LLVWTGFEEEPVALEESSWHRDGGTLCSPRLLHFAYLRRAVVGLFCLFFVCLFVCLFGCCCFFFLRVDSEQDQLILFLEGFGEGVVSDLGNLTECVNDTTTMLSDFDQAYVAIRQGINHVNPFEVEKGVRLFSAALKELSLAIGDCGSQELVSDIERIVAQIESGPTGYVRLIVDEILNVFSHRNQIGYAFRQALKAWEAPDRQYFAAGFYTGQIVGILIQDQPAR